MSPSGTWLASDTSLLTAASPSVLLAPCAAGATAPTCASFACGAFCSNGAGWAALAIPPGIVSVVAVCCSGVVLVGCCCVVAREAIPVANFISARCRASGVAYLAIHCSRPASVIVFSGCAGLALAIPLKILWSATACCVSCAWSMALPIFDSGPTTGIFETGISGGAACSAMGAGCSWTGACLFLSMSAAATVERR